MANPQDAVTPANGAATSAAPEQLRAIFIDVNGNVRWRANAESAWQTAKVNDVVTSGVEVSTGLRSRAALRVGRNATILLDSGTALTIPTVVQEGDTLHTTASVARGRADFKVDKVGLTNDFRVVTPSTTLAVKGTEFAVATGALKQVEIVGARRNVINAIELKYALNNQTVQMSGGANSTSDSKNPAHAAVLATSVPTVGNTPKSGNNSIKDAVTGPAPVESGSSSQASSSRQATTATESATGKSDSSVAASMARAIALANQRTEQAIDLLIHAAEQADIAEAQADVLASLKQLADARKAEALASLASHQQALNTAKAGLASAVSNQNVLNGQSSLLTTHLNTFHSQNNSASALLAQIENVITNEGCGDLNSLAQQATAALMGMNTALEHAEGNLQNMAAQLAAVNAIIGTMDTSTRPQAAAAIAAYQQAMASLQQLASAGAGPAAIAAAAQSAASQLQLLIQQLNNQAQTTGSMAAAAQALTVLANANTALAQSQAALDAIRAARDAAGAAGNAAQLGVVEQLYQQIVAVRAAMATNLLAQAGLVNGAEAVADSTNSYAENVFALLGNYWRDVTTVDANNASAAAVAASQADAQAVAAKAQFDAAVGSAESTLADAQNNYSNAVTAAGGVSTAHTGLNDAASHAMAALNSIATLGHPGMEAALQALDALEQALGQIVTQYANFQGVAGQQPSGADLAGVQAQGDAALQALMTAIANAQAASAQASQSAGGAADASAAAALVRDLALQLAERFGLNMDGALAAAAQAYAEAVAAGNSAGAAANSAQHAEALALLARADAIGNIAAQIDALLSQSNNLSAEALAELQAAQASYTAVNEYGAEVFADLSEGNLGDASGQSAMARQAMNALHEMSSVSTAYVGALDGAEGAARGAEGAARNARGERINAERNYDHTQGSFSQMNAAISAGNWSAANDLRNQTVSYAGMSNQNANAAAGYANQATGYYSQAQQYGAVADQLKATLDQYGTNAQQWNSAAAAFKDQVNNANQAMADIQARADFYDGVAQMLAGRAATDPAFAAALRSGDAHAQVLAIAQQLSNSANDAAQLEKTARTNAERMFYRSARQYVERAGVAAQNALRDADRAREAADRAANVANQAQQTSGSGTQ